MFSSESEFEAVGLQVYHLSFFAGVEVYVMNLTLVCAYENVVVAVPDAVKILGLGVLSKEIDCRDSFALRDV